MKCWWMEAPRNLPNCPVNDAEREVDVKRVLVSVAEVLMVVTV